MVHYSLNTHNQIIEGKDSIIYQISSSKNQLEMLKNKTINNYNLSIIDLGECENQLKEAYNLNKEDDLIIVK